LDVTEGNVMSRDEFWKWMETCPNKDWIIVEEYSADNPSDNDYYNYDYVDISFTTSEEK
tara:strand:- start:153 stop:329 length:177 start_codon:yes stop_codon:yes gene_type:complete